MLLFCANFYKASWLVSYAPLANFFVSALSWDVARIRARRGASRGQIRRCQRLRFISTARVRVKSWVRSQTLSDSNHSIQIDPILISASAASGAVTRDIIRKLTMRTPRGGKALSRAASGRVPGPSTAAETAAATPAATEPKAPEASTKFAAPTAKPAPPAKPIATPEEAAAWAARIPKQVRPPPPGQPAKPVAAQPAASADAAVSAE